MVAAFYTPRYRKSISISLGGRQESTHVGYGVLVAVYAGFTARTNALGLVAAVLAGKVGGELAGPSRFELLDGG